MNDNKEKFQGGQETDVEVRQSVTEQLEKLDKKTEASVELSPRDIEARSEKARQEALETAVGVEVKGKVAEKTKEHTSSSRRNGSINKKQRDESYKRTMKRVQSELPANSRLFSKFIHNKSVEKISDAVGNTVARPNAILAGAVTAFLLTLITYTIAKKIGYVLSGFETIAAFIIGWIIGLVYDYIKVMITGKKS